MPIVAPEFGDTTDFTEETIYILSQNAIVKGVYSFEYEKSF